MNLVEGMKLIDTHGQIWIVKWNRTRDDWYLWKPDTGWGLVNDLKGLKPIRSGITSYE